jgi:hypothetical protein
MKMPARRKTNKQKILNFLGSGKKLTTAKAEGSLRIGRLSARVFELRNDGWKIFTHRVNRNGKVVYYYSLPTNQQGTASLV